MNNPSIPEVGGRSAKFALILLVIVYVFNFIDRQILTILAEDLKADLNISDSDIGFLYGTAFAVFYSVVGIPMGKLADTWNRKNLISLGLAFWSLMTFLSGTAKSFLSLSIYRFGVGIGESSASPASYSLLSDYFSPKVRATVLSIYASGLYIGSGIGIFIGGLIVDNWNEAFPIISEAPFGLKGWQVAFMAVGLPGILLALITWQIKEPPRGLSEGLTETTAANYRNKFLGFIFQSFNLINYKNALENVALPLYYQGLGRKIRQVKALGYLEKVGLKDWATHLPSELSGGQKQRVAIARAMASEPKVLLADEPTGALDSKTSTEVMSLIQQINSEGKTILVVTHELDIANMCKRIVKLKDGVIVDDQKVDQVIAENHV